MLARKALIAGVRVSPDRQNIETALSHPRYLSNYEEECMKDMVLEIMRKKFNQTKCYRGITIQKGNVLANVNWINTG